MVFCHGRLVVRIDRTVGSDELPPNHHVNIEINVCLTDTRYDIFDVRLILGGCGFLVRGPRTEDGTLAVFYLEYVKLGFRRRARHPEPASGHKITSIRKICPVLYSPSFFVVVFNFFFFCRRDLISASLLLLSRFFSLP